MTTTNGSTLAQKVLMLILGILLPAFLAFLIWLATTVVEIKVGVAETKRDVASLLDSRREEIARRTQINTERIRKLEQEEIE
jgi:hypothetical protein